MAYSMIIVDDEMLAIEGVTADLDAERLGIAELFTANTSKQAKEIFARERIDILLCDIEMPQGSGLELLAWVKEYYPSTEAIIFTSHADFQYAKEAMRLGSLDYLLKPVMQADLEKVIRKAQNAIEQRSESNRHSQSHQLWMKHQSLIVERFWIDLINHTMPSDASAIRDRIERQKIPLSDHAVFLPLLISVNRWNKELDGRGEKIMEYALKNSAEELYLNEQTNGIFFTIDRGQLLGIFTSDQGGCWEMNRLIQASVTYIESCNRLFYCDISCYFGQAVNAQEVAGAVASLREKDRNNVAAANRVYMFDERILSTVPIELPTLNTWLALLKAGKKEPALREVEKLVRELAHNQSIDRKTLSQFHLAILQTLYSYLDAKGIQAHQLFGDDDSIRLSEQAGRSIEDLLIWVQKSIDKALAQAEAVEKSDTVVETIKRHIAANIDQEISRESIAEMVFLHPDYLSRLFKKETGTSITDYITTERVSIAKKLLANTNIPISSIASSVGYSNFSHFGRTLKKYTGLGPMEYRAQFGNNNGSNN